MIPYQQRFSKFFYPFQNLVLSKKDLIHKKGVEEKKREKI